MYTFQPDVLCMKFSETIFTRMIIMECIVLYTLWSQLDKYWFPASPFTWEWIQSIACLYPIQNTHAHELLNLGALKYSLLNELHIF